MLDVCPEQVRAAGYVTAGHLTGTRLGTQQQHPAVQPAASRHHACCPCAAPRPLQSRPGLAPCHPTGLYAPYRRSRRTPSPSCRRWPQRTITRWAAAWLPSCGPKCWGRYAGLGVDARLRRSAPGPLRHPHLDLPPLPMQAVIAKLDEMMGCDPAYILPSIEALGNLCLTPDQQVGLGAGAGCAVVWLLQSLQGRRGACTLGHSSCAQPSGWQRKLPVLPSAVPRGGAGAGALSTGGGRRPARTSTLPAAARGARGGAQTGALL